MGIFFAGRFTSGLVFILTLELGLAEKRVDQVGIVELADSGCCEEDFAIWDEDIYQTHGQLVLFFLFFPSTFSFSLSPCLSCVHIYLSRRWLVIWEPVDI